MVCRVRKEHLVNEFCFPQARVFGEQLLAASPGFLETSARHSRTHHSCFHQESARAAASQAFQKNCLRLPVHPCLLSQHPVSLHMLAEGNTIESGFLKIPTQTLDGLNRGKILL